MTIEGGCLCGAVRYRAEGAIGMTFLCHCRDCQLQSGSGNLPLMVVPRTGFSVEGATTGYESTGDSGRKAIRHFCPVCGSTLYADAEALPKGMLIAAATLDDTSRFHPAKSIHIASRVHWDHIVEPVSEA